MDKKTIMIVDDEIKIVILLKDFLEREGFHIIEANDGATAIQLFEENHKIDMILLDIMLPEYDGWTVCREIRKKDENVHIIMLTARGEDFDEIHGFEIGADDYVKKPVKPSALVARINAHFRKIDKIKNIYKNIDYDWIKVDTASHTVIIEAENIELSPKEYLLLLILIQNKGIVVSREQLLTQVWGYEYFGGYRTVDTHINRLRIKMKDRCDAITTVRGFGYKFE